MSERCISNECLGTKGSAGKEKGKKSKNCSIKYVCSECGGIIRRRRRSTWYAGTVTYHSSGNEKSASRKKNGWR